MSALKSWFPFRFSRKNKAASEAAPAKATRADDRGVTIAGMREEMDRMFDRMWSNPLAPFGQSDDWFGDFSSARFSPKLDVSDDAECLKLTLEVVLNREKYDWKADVGFGLTNQAGNLVAIASRQVHIHQYQVGIKRVHCRDDFFGIGHDLADH